MKTGDKVAIFWFRRDLRLEDNVGLYYALTSGMPVVPVFVFDTDILDNLESPFDRRVDFIHRSLTSLAKRIGDLGGTIKVFHGRPIDIFKQLVETLPVGTVFANRDYEPYACRRDDAVEALLNRHQIRFLTYKDQVIFEKDEVLKPQGQPYTVYTPYSKRWKKQYFSDTPLVYPSEKFLNNLFRAEPEGNLISLSDLGFQPTDLVVPPKEVDEGIIANYDLDRDYPARRGTSRLSVHLRFGTISIRTLVSKAVKLSEKWLNELIWREFYMMILWHFPHVTERCFKPQYEDIEWDNNEEHFRAWCEGRSGYPIVDAGMRELNETGYMHNRLRMITASFLVKHLLIDWRWGEAYFASKLNDFDLAANNGGWQWCASTGCDAVPYFRIFNPHLQTEKFDPERDYISQWVPEWNTHSYPLPIIDHATARERALLMYKRAAKTVDV